MYVLFVIVLAIVILYSLYVNRTATHTTAVEEHEARYWFVHMFNESHGLPDIPYSDEQPKHIIGLSYFGWDSLARYFRVANARSQDVAKVLVPKTYTPKPVFHHPDIETEADYWERKACRKRNYNRVLNPTGRQGNNWKDNSKAHKQYEWHRNNKPYIVDHSNPQAISPKVRRRHI